MQQKVECKQVGKLEPNDVAVDHAFKMFGDAFGCEVFREQWIPLRAIRNDTNICSVALVATAGMGQVEHANAHRLLLDVNARGNGALVEERRPIRDNLFNLGAATGKS